MGGAGGEAEIIRLELVINNYLINISGTWVAASNLQAQIHVSCVGTRLSACVN